MALFRVKMQASDGPPGPPPTWDVYVVAETLRKAIIIAAERCHDEFGRDTGLTPPAPIGAERLSKRDPYQ